MRIAAEESALAAPDPAAEPPAGPIVAASTEGPAARDPDRPKDRAAPVIMPGMTVVGSADEVREIAGSAAYLGPDQIRGQGYEDVGQVLRRVPGVAIRPEEGYGLFPNISLRGVDTTRSSKVTLMEDGVLIAPAPYSSPAAYFNPAVGRMSGIEVLKGSSQVRYGPHTTGGVINYISTPIPTELHAYLRTVYGTNSEARIHGYVGDTIETPFGRIGYLAEGFFRRTDGFKRIDQTPDFRDRNNTGFTQIEPMIKLAWEPPTDMYQRIELKVGYSDVDADETYLGLTEEDFRRRHERRYAASRFDNFEAQHLRAYARHHADVSEEFGVTTTYYYNKFHRNWFKLRRINDAAAGGTGNVGLSEALAGGGTALDVLRGDAAGRLDYRNNNRDYYVMGLESVATIDLELGATAHKIVAGVRAHEDRKTRDQQDESFVQDDNGTITDRTVGAPSAGGPRRQRARSLAFFLEDAIRLGSLTVKPGFRYERVWMRQRDYLDANPETARGRGTMDLVAGGIGLTYELTPELMAFGGVYTGYSVPSPRAHIRQGIDEERSFSTELGIRYANLGGWLQAEAAFFLTRFEDLIVIDNQGGTGTGDTENVGRVRSLGVELAVQADPGIALELPVRLPIFASFTYTDARLRSDSNSTDAESLFAGGRKNNHAPYVPEFAVSLGIGIETDRFGISLVASYLDDMYTTASNTRQQLDADGNPDSRFGKTGDAWLLDISAYFEIVEGVRVVGGVQNALDERYVASRHPEGPRPGLPLFAYVGMELTY